MAVAAVNDGERLCDAALTATRAELADRKELAAADQDLVKLLRRQRDDAFKMLDRQPPTMPWYFWTILGGAAASIAFELRR
jgi:hypothetical protein